MDNTQIDFLVNGITARENAIKAELADMTGTPDNLLKVHRLLELLGGASGELAFIKEQLLADKKPIRRFAILKKTA